MKTILTTLALTTVSTQAWATYPSPADTVVHINSPKEITVTDNGAVTTVLISGTDRRPDYHFEYSVNADTADTSPAPALVLPVVGAAPGSSSRREVTFFSDVYTGIVIPYHAPSSVRTSWEMGVGNFIGYRYRFGDSGASLGFGAGFGARQFNIRRAMTASTDGDCLSLQPAPEGASDISTSVTSWNIQIPFYYRQRFYRSLTFQISAILNYNVSTRAKSRYTLDNVIYTDKVSGLHQRLITPDFRFTIGSGYGAGIYVRWSPVKMFKRAYGPDIATLAAGLSLFF